MQIKEQRQSGIVYGLLNACLDKHFLVLVISLILFASGFYLGTNREIYKTVHNFIATSHIDREMISNYLKGVMATPKTMIIDIKQSHFKRLEYKRQQALQRKIIVTDEDSYVPAKISVDGHTYKVKMRLKGDYTDHLEGDKWSYRIKVKGDRTIWGMSHFSIQDPMRSGFLKEWILYELFRHEDLIALRYDFIEVIINGKNYGVFALEESFAKELIEHNRRREGPILKFDESAQIDKSLFNKGNGSTQTDIFYAADIISFTTSKLLKNPDQKTMFITARSRLNDFRLGKKKLSEIMDVKRAARTFAILNVVNGFHAIRWKNSRFYYNPVTGLIELIPYNAYGPGNEVYPTTALLYHVWSIRKQIGWFVSEWLDLFLRDENFVANYLQELDRITQPGYLEHFFDLIKTNMDEKLSYIYKDGPLARFPTEVYLQNRDTLHQLLHPKQKARVYLKQSTPEQVTISLANTNLLPIRLLSFDCNGKLLSGFQTSFIPGKEDGKPLVYSDITLTLAAGQTLDCLRDLSRQGDTLVLTHAHLNYEIAGIHEMVSSPVDAYPINHIADQYASQLRGIQSLQKLRDAGIATFTSNREIRLKPTNIILNSDLVIPEGFNLIAPAGTRFVLQQHAALISKSPIQFLGSPKNPVVIDSQDHTGQGLVVIAAKQPSLLRYVLVNNMKAIEKQAWKLTGAITFYESDITIENSKFGNNQSEDLINIVRSKFKITSSEFFNTTSDALDIDFGEGQIVASNFKNCHNDCIDISGTKAHISDLSISRTNDKGISVGEKSDATFAKIAIEQANIGIASKDSSIVEAREITIKTSAIGLAAYQKKPEFEGGHINVHQLTMENVTTPYEYDAISTIKIDGNTIPSHPTP